MAGQDLSTIVIAYKKQAGLGTPASGASAKGLEVIPSSGIARRVATIESELISTTRMRKKPRHGSNSVTAAYETELMVGALDEIYAAILGCNATASFTQTQATLTSAAVSGSGVTLTFAGGDIIGAGARVGMMAKLTGMTVAGNNNKWFPLLGISANGRVVTTCTGILADEAADSSFSFIIAKSYSTPTPYLDTYYSLEEYWTTADRGKLGTDMKFNQMAFDVRPDKVAKVSIGLGGRALSLLASGSSPNFTSPVYVSDEGLVLLDGQLLVNGVAKANVTGLTAGLAAPITLLPVVSSRTSPDTYLGQFAFTGQITAAVEDGTEFDAFDAETQISQFLRFAERGSTFAEDFVSVYMGNLSYAGNDTPVGGEGALIQSVPVYGGRDDRGSPYAATTMLISTSAA